MKKIRKRVNIWRSYNKNLAANFSFHPVVVEVEAMSLRLFLSVRFRSESKSFFDITWSYISVKHKKLLNRID